MTVFKGWSGRDAWPRWWTGGNPRPKLSLPDLHVFLNSKKGCEIIYRAL